MNLKMLYLSCHAVLEYNEISLFNEIDIDVFCLGSYIDPMHPHDSIRPSIDKQSNPEFMRLSCLKDALTRELVEKFDIIYIVHIPDWIVKNWNIIKDKIVIWRSIGQSNINIEKILGPYRQDIKIIRYSPFEKNIPGYIGDDAIIRFHLDPEEFNNWNGSLAKVITVGQHMKGRGVSCSFNIFEQATRGFPRIVYGPGNEDIGELNGGKIPYDDLKKALRDNRVYFYTGTHPASYTLNFIEAWMTGIPIVAIGNQYGNANYFSQMTYEIPTLIQNGFNGFCSDDINTLYGYCKNIIEDEYLARRIGNEGRKSAIEYFGKDNIKKQWQELFNNIMKR